jgi:putative transposase
MDAHRAGDSDAKIPTAMSLHRQWNHRKQGPEGIPWWTEVSKCAPQEAFRNLERAMHAFWASRRGERRGPLVRFPRFKKKGHHDAFRLAGSIRLQAPAVTLPRIGAGRLCEDAARWVERVRVGEISISSATVSREADRWFCSLAVVAERRIPEHNGHIDVIGVDLGVLQLATLSDGTVVAGPKALRRSLRRLRRRPVPTAANEGDPATVPGPPSSWAALQLGRHHAKVAAIRRDHLHKLKTQVAKRHGQIAIDDLNVTGMLRNRKLARLLADAGSSEFRRQLPYKCQWYGSELIVADRWFASSKICSRCNTVKTELWLRERTYQCDACGLKLDRDLTAAVNLAGWVHPEVASSAGDILNGRGEDARPGSGPADLVEAATGTAPELTGLTGGPDTHDRGHVASCPMGWNGGL